MKIHRPLWSEGVLLSPQQFQQQSALDTFTHNAIVRLSGPFTWGVEQVVFNDELLATGLIQLEQLRLWLPDGTLIDTQISDPPPPARELHATHTADLNTVTVLLALPLLQPNVANMQSDKTPSERPLRFRETWHKVDDLFGEEQESIAVAEHNLSLRFAHEINDSWHTCPLGRLIYDGRQGWRQDETYIPPLASFAASKRLQEKLILLNRQIRSRCQHLMAMRRESNERLADFAVADVSLFWLLNALNTHAHVLTHYERYPARPPEQVWRELVHLAGSMLTFSLEHQLDNLPHYVHEYPEQAFIPLFELIATLLEASLPSRVVALPMTKTDEQTWKATLHDMRLREQADFYLSVRSDIPAWQIAERIPALCKAGSPDNVNQITSVALSGIPLIPLTRVPALLPSRLDNYYFALDIACAAGKAMLEQGVCLFYVPSLLGNLQLELYAVLRT